MENYNEFNDQDFIYALAVLERQEGVPLCVSARQSGLYLSDDGCRTWRSAYTSLNLEAPLPTTCLAAASDFATRPMLIVGVPGGVLISEDGGASWLSAHLPSPAPLPSALAISPDFARDNLLLMGSSEDGVLRSINQGASWKAWNFGLVDFNVLCLAISPAFAEDQTVYAGVSTGLVVSRSGGRSWRELILPSSPAAVLSLAVSPAFAQDGRLYAGTEGAGLFTSADRGKNWTRLGAGILEGNINQVLIPGAKLAPGANPAPGADAAGLWVVHEDALFHSPDGGETWSQVIAEGVACIAAARGLSPRGLLVGMSDGSVKPL